MIPDYRILMRVAAKCIKEEFSGVHVLREAVKRYSLRGSEAWVANLFPVHFLDNGPEYVKLYDSFKIAIQARDLSVFRNLVMSIADVIPTQTRVDAFLILNDP